MHAGRLLNSDTMWLKKQIESFVVHDPAKKKPGFRYHLPIIGPCCRAAWVLAAGFKNAKNSRVTSLEAKIRSGNCGVVSKKRHPNTTNFATRSNFAKAFIEEYIWLHSQKSPSNGNLYVYILPTHNTYCTHTHITYIHIYTCTYEYMHT